MKKIVVCLALVMLLALGGSAFAQGKKMDDLSWWGKSGATPAPVKDSLRSGSWWWPIKPASNVDDKELWGNRGVVYHILKAEPKVEVAQPAPAPPEEKPVIKKREKPVFANVLFDFDKSFLKPEGKVVVNEVVAELKMHAKDTLVVEGHTCDIGTDAYNMGLSQRRADSVKKFMLDNGIECCRVGTKAFGETQPAVPNSSEANRKLNRRAVFDFTLGD